MSDAVVNARTGQPVVELRGRLAGDLAEYARHKIGAVLARSRGPVLHSRVHIVRHADPARERPVTAEATIDLNGIPIHVDVVAASPREAVDMLVDRLTRRLERVEERWAGRRGHSGHVRTRETIRHRVADPTPQSVDDAVAAMTKADDDFHLFVEKARGVDSLVARDESGGIDVVQVDGRAAGIGAVPAGVAPSPAVPPVLDTAAARARLRASGASFLFYIDAGHGRGSVLYLRGDLHLGLLSLHAAFTAATGSDEWEGLPR